MSSTTVGSPEINFNNLVKHELSKEKADRITTDFTVDASSKLVIFNPLRRFRKMWDILLSFLLAFNLVVTPFTIGFSMLEGTGSVIFWLNRFVDLLFIADIGLNFETGIYAGEKIIMDKATVHRLYLRGWFAVDFISSIPLDLVVSLIILKSHESSALLSTDGPKLYDNLTVVEFMQVFRLLKLLKTIKIYENFEKALVFRYEDLGILRFLFFILFSLHWSACIFSWLDENVCLQGEEYSSFVSSGLEDESRRTKYIAALYWALATMTTIGYGDISAQCSATRVFSLIVMMVSTVVYAYGLSYVMEVMRNKNKVESEFRELMDLVNKYMAFRKIPKDLREEIRKFFNYVSESDAKKNDLLSERVILEELSPELRVAVLCHVNSGLLEKVPLFNQIQECIGQSRSILQEMVLHMRSQVFRPLEVVLKQGNAGNEIFFVTSGTCVQIKWNAITVNVITEGEYYGEGGFLHQSYQPHKSQLFDMTEIHQGGSSFKRNANAGPRGFSSHNNLLGADLLGASKGTFGIDLDVGAERPSADSAGSMYTGPPEHQSLPMGKRHTFTTAPQSPSAEIEHVRAQQRNSTTIGSASLVKDGSVNADQNNTAMPKPYSQCYSLVTQSFADLRYITRELYDKIVKTLPRNKFLKVNRLMRKRYQELTASDEKRDLELERLYPEIKEDFLADQDAHDVDEEEEEIDWRKQEVDFVEEEVIEQATFDIIHHQTPNVTSRRGSVSHPTNRRASLAASRRPSTINMLMSPRKKPHPLPSPRRMSSPAGGRITPPGMQSHPPARHFNFDTVAEGFPHSTTQGTKELKKSYSLGGAKQQLKKSGSLALPSPRSRRKTILRKGSSGVLGSQDNSISNVIRKEHFTTTTPNIFQNAVPTMAIVHQGHNRFLERALCLAGPNAEKTEKTENDSDSDSDSSVGSAAYSLKSFSDFDEDSAMSVVLDSNSPVLVPPQKTQQQQQQQKPSRTTSSDMMLNVDSDSTLNTLENIETIERSLSTLFGHVTQLKKEMSMKHGLVAVTEGEEED